LKNVRILKKFKFENCSKQKIVQTKNVHILKLFKFENMVKAGRAHGGDNNDWDGRYGGCCQVLMNRVDLRSSSIAADANSTSSATLNSTYALILLI
jgi:hypothetical protein